MLNQKIKRNGVFIMCNDNYGKKWTRDETILALSFYYEMPYGKINRSNKYLQSMADLMHRSLSSLIMKMVNLGMILQFVEINLK